MKAARIGGQGDAGVKMKQPARLRGRSECAPKADQRRKWSGPDKWFPFVGKGLTTTL
jgi:hypothetical protein